MASMIYIKHLIPGDEIIGFGTVEDVREDRDTRMVHIAFKAQEPGCFKGKIKTWRNDIAYQCVRGDQRLR